MVSETFDLRHLNSNEATPCREYEGRRLVAPSSQVCARDPENGNTGPETLAQVAISLADEKAPQGDWQIYLCSLLSWQSNQFANGQKANGHFLLRVTFIIVTASYWKGDEGYGPRQRREEKKQCIER